MAFRLSVRRFALLAFSSALFVFSFATAAVAADVNLRVESLSGTITNGPVSTIGADIKTTASSSCADDDSASVNYATPNSLTALANWATANSVAYNTQYGGTFLCKVADSVGNPAAYWMLKVNNKTMDGKDYILGTSAVKTGDEVLWYFTDDYAKPTLALTLPATIQTGTAAAGSVASYDGADDSKAAASGVAVSGGGGSATSGVDGSFSITFPTAGKFLVSATKSSAIRASAWVTVTDAPVPAPPTNKEKRVEARAACRAQYPSKEGEKYTECVRAANNIGHKQTNKEKRIVARAKCVKNFPNRNSNARIACIRKANAIGR